MVQTVVRSFKQSYGRTVIVLDPVWVMVMLPLVVIDGSAEL